MKRRRKQYSEEFKQSVITYLRQNGLSANKVAKIYKLDQTTVSKWNRQIEAGPIDSGTIATVISHSQTAARTTRASAESLSTLFVVGDDLLPKLLKDSAHHIIYARLTDPYHPERRAGEESWKGIYCELDLCLRDIQSLTVQLKLDHSLLHQNYARLLLIREAWIRGRHEQLSCEAEHCNETEEGHPRDPLEEETKAIDKIIGLLRQLVIISRSSL